jgi:hypothetical protein
MRQGVTGWFLLPPQVADVSHSPSDRAELAEALQQRMHTADLCKRWVCHTVACAKAQCINAAGKVRTSRFLVVSACEMRERLFAGHTTHLLSV